jgi:hypothetical protein
MKTEEDEAFDELAKRQGGGFPAKRQAAMDKINSDFDEEYKKSSAVLAKYRIEDDDDIQEYKRPWVGLTEEDFSAINQSCLTKLQAATSAESILKRKNT